MTRKILNPIILLILLMSLGCSHTKSNQSEIKEEYQSPEQCEKRCEEWFKKNYGNEYGHQNHYNKKLHKCLILVTGRSLPKNKDKGFVFDVLYDLNENKLYGSFNAVESFGSFTPFACNVLEKTCNSEKEWDLLVKPYMED